MQERNRRPRSQGSFLIVPIVQENERDRQLRGSPIAGFFEMRDLPYLNIGIRDIKAKWGRDLGVHGKKNFYRVLNENSKRRF